MSGLAKPSRAVERITAATTMLLALPPRGEPRTREGEREKAWQR